MWSRDVCGARRFARQGARLPGELRASGEAQGREGAGYILPGALDVDVLVDVADHAVSVHVEGPAARVEPPESGDAILTGGHLTGVREQDVLRAQRFGERAILFGFVEADHIHDHVVLSELIGAVPQRLEFLRSARGKGLRKPREDDAAFPPMHRQAVQFAVGAEQLEARSRRAGGQAPRLCRRRNDGEPGENRQDGGDGRPHWRDDRSDREAFHRAPCTGALYRGAMDCRIALRHETRYAYDRPASLGPHLIRLRPAPHCRTPISRYALHVVPERHTLNWQNDPQGNFVARVVFAERSPELRVRVDLVADLAQQNPLDFLLDPAAENWPYRYSVDVAAELAPHLELASTGAVLRAWVDSCSQTPGATVAFLAAVNQRHAAEIAYETRSEPGVRSPEQTLDLRRGSCRDSAWLLVQTLRHLGIAARFVSGYLIELADATSSGGVERDAAELHAWAEVYLPGAGWVGLDPTSGFFTGGAHLPLACSPRPEGAAPIAGTVEPCETRFSHSLTLRRLAATA